MKKTVFRLISLVLCCLLLTGCVPRDSADAPKQSQKGASASVHFQDMVYTRPDMEQLESALSLALTAAAGTDFEQIMDLVYGFYDLYDAFYTNYSLADIHYCRDLTDPYWQEESDFCTQAASRVDAALEELYYGLAQSPCLAQLESEAYFGSGYFDSYQGENLWDADFTALLEQESALVSRYYELRSEGSAYPDGSQAFYDACGEDLIQLLLELICLRHEIAAWWGYDDYAQFATDFYHYRDYSMDQSRTYLTQVGLELSGLYRQLNESGFWDSAYRSCTEAQTYAYLETMAANMGGTVGRAFRLMDEAGLYDITCSPNKYAASFEVYLTGYSEPFIFLSPMGDTSDFLTFAHEFGHFCCDYASHGSYAGVDVLEIFSQGMEFLSLFYTEDSGDLTRVKMAESLCLYVEQSAYASFEMRMYDIPPESLTPEALTELYTQVALEYGFESIGYDPREFIFINHFYTNPMYVLSYVVSNDAAMQLYQLELETPGAGLARLQANLATEEYYLLSFLSRAGLESPFAPGRLRSVRKIFEDFFC